MRTLIIIIFFILSCSPKKLNNCKAIQAKSVNLDSQKNNCNNLVISKFAKGFIIIPSYNEVRLNICCAFWKNKIWEPSQTLIVEFEDTLLSNLNRNQITIFAHKSDEYIRQYVGVCDSNNQKFLWINFEYWDIVKSSSFTCIEPYSTQIAVHHTSLPGYNFIMFYDVTKKKIVSINKNLNKD